MSLTIDSPPSLPNPPAPPPAAAAPASAAPALVTPGIGFDIGKIPAFDELPPADFEPAGNFSPGATAKAVSMLQRLRAEWRALGPDTPAAIINEKNLQLFVIGDHAKRQTDYNYDTSHCQVEAAQSAWETAMQQEMHASKVLQSAGNSEKKNALSVYDQARAERTAAEKVLRTARSDLKEAEDLREVAYGTPRGELIAAKQEVARAKAELESTEREAARLEQIVE